MSSVPSSLTPSTQRPIPMQMRKDLRTRRIEYQGGDYWVVKDPVGLTYHRLQPEQFRILELLDGRRSLEDLKHDLQHDFPYSRPTLTDLQGTVIDLHSKRLARSIRIGQGHALVESRRRKRKERVKAFLSSLLYMRLPGWDPERTLTLLYPLVRWMFHPWAVALMTALVAASGLLLAVKFAEFQSRLPEFRQFFGWPNLMFLWFTLAATKIVHELGHGISCKHYGGECHQIGVMLLVFSPTLYCDVSDSWMLRNKWQRIVIGAAGMYIESILAAVALFGWWFTQPGLINHLCLNVFFVSAATTVIFNLNPLMRYDGYYMLSDLLEIPNLSQKANRMLQETFAWQCLGIRPRPDPFMPDRGKFWFITYAISSAIYRWVVLFGITLFLYVILKPYDLQSIGIALAVAGVAGVVATQFQNLVKILRTPRQEPLNRTKVSLTVLSVLALLACALFVPFPWYIGASFYIEPRDVRHVFNAVPGELAEIHVRPGQTVREGDLLVLLKDPEKLRHFEAMLTERRAQEVELSVYSAIDDKPGVEQVRERLASIAQTIDDYERQLQELVVRAPAGGMVVAPSRIPEPKLSETRTELGEWHGTPIDSRNLGCSFETRTHLLSIAPDARFQAVLLIDQGDRGDIEVGRELDIKFDHLPTRTYHGVIEEISDRHADYAPESLSNKAGGELPTVTDAKGRERLTSRAYHAVVLLNCDVNLLRTGIRGRARFFVGHRSAAAWLWRGLRRTLEFRL
jgi:putative peptide zinc metalloprotease protein